MFRPWTASLLNGLVTLHSSECKSHTAGREKVSFHKKHDQTTRNCVFLFRRHVNVFCDFVDATSTAYYFLSPHPGRFLAGPVARSPYRSLLRSLTRCCPPTLSQRLATARGFTPTLDAAPHPLQSHPSLAGQRPGIRPTARPLLQGLFQC